MRITKVLILTVLFVMTIGLVLAQTTVSYKDNSTPTCGTALKLNAEYPGGTYPTGSGTGRWKIQFYKDGTDGIISPLDPSTHLPAVTSDDVVLNNGNSLQDVIISVVGPNKIWNGVGINFQPTGTAVNGHTGDRIFAAIFNSSSVVTATKYMILRGLYTVPPSGTPSVYVNSTLSPTGWSEWVPFAAPNPIISGSVTSGFSNFGVTLSCTGTYTDTQTTPTNGTFAFSIPTGANITITPSKTGYVFTPASYTNTNVTGNVSNVAFTMIAKAPGLAINPTPSSGATNVPVLIGSLQWEFSPIAGYSNPTGFKVYFPADAVTYTTVPYADGITTYSMPIDQLEYNQDYTWKVVPSNAYKGEQQEATIRATGSSVRSSKTDATGAIVWSFKSKAAQIIYPGINAAIDFDGGGSLGNFIFGTPSTVVVPGTPQIVYLVIPLASVPELPAAEWITTGYALSLNAPTTTTLTVTVPAGRWFVNAYYNGHWNNGNPANPVIGPAEVVFDNLPFGGKAEIPVIFTQGIGDPTLPVTLSSFTAIYSVGFFVQLTWVVQSETNHLGYNVLRSDDDVLANAVKINPSFVSSGSASGTQITYNYRDEEVLDNTTYNYWLESVDLDGTTYFFGPVNVVVNNDGEPEVPPVIPTVTELLNAYPNPFNPMTLIPYTLKTQGDVKIDIYNVKGEFVRNLVNENKNAGSYQIPWNGKDSEGKSISSGIYYYRMSSGKYTASKKIILVK